MVTIGVSIKMIKSLMVIKLPGYHLTRHYWNAACAIQSVKCSAILGNPMQ